jgi:steroid 5-alpha reductase family enzyme
MLRTLPPAPAQSFQFDKITDFAGSANFVILAVLTLCCGGQYHPRQIAVTAMLCVSRIELAIFLLWRVIKRGRDARFDEVRTKFFPFLIFWIFQILWVYGVSISVVFVNTAFNKAPLGVLDYVGIGIFTLGFGVQVVADFQKYGFRANPANKGKLCDIGVWGISRHPYVFANERWW